MGFIVPFIAPILGAVGGALVSKAFAPKPPDLSAIASGGTPTGDTPGDIARRAEEERRMKARAIRTELPGLQERLGGSVSPDYYAQMAALLSGNADAFGTARDVVGNWLGLSGGDTGLTSSPNFFGGGGSGGGGLFGGGGGVSPFPGVDFGGGDVDLMKLAGGLGV